ncbi:MAG: trypsin-like peptidase domain-containing protein [Eubacteriales bacterium]|nr:trypsin-like peptidase domain-containing protein [Eubacteriales bacterium]
MENQNQNNFESIDNNNINPYNHEHTPEAYSGLSNEPSIFPDTPKEAGNFSPEIDPIYQDYSTQATAGFHTDNHNPNQQNHFGNGTYQTNPNNTYFYSNMNFEQPKRNLSYQEVKKQRTEKKQKKNRFLKAVSFLLAIALTFYGSFQLGSYYTEQKLDEKINSLRNELQQSQNISSPALPLPNTSGSESPNTTSAITSSGTVSPVVAIAERVVPSVVTITSLVKESVMNPFFGNQTQSYRESGSGVVYKLDAENVYIVTNHHVIEKGHTINVNFFTEESAPAEVMGYDSKNDLAVLKVKLSDLKNKDLKAAQFGDSSALKVGQLAVAIGNPLGEGHDHTITSGIISSVNRTLNIENIKDLEVIQTDAAINPGNSGGALVNEYGQVIGINTAKYLDVKVEGMGFAIPSNIALSVVEKIVKNGSGDAAYALSDDRPFLGIGFSNINNEIYAQTGIPFGIYVNKVYKNSAADKAGVKEGDILFSLNGIRIKDSGMLFDSIGKLQVGQTVKIGLVREEQVFEVEATITSYGEVNKQDK